MNYQSPTIHIDGIELSVHANAEGVTLVRTVDGVYASDLVIESPDLAAHLGSYLIEASQRVRIARGG